MKTLEDRLPVRPRRNWDTIEQYVEWLRHFAAYKYVEKFVDGKSVLEVGCGAGYGANYLSQFSSNVMAIDISKRNITYSHIKYKKEKLAFVQASGLNIPLKDGSIDVALSFQVIEHIEPKKLAGFLSEIKRTLKDKSVLVVTTPNKKIRLLPFQKRRNPEHEKEYDSKGLKKILGGVFEEVEVYGLKGSEEIQSIVRNQLKQNAFMIYVVIAIAVIRPITPLIKKILPSTSLFQIRKINKTARNKEERTAPIINKVTERLQIGDFKLMPNCPKDCLDIYGVCKKIKTSVI
jgi:ubiquinone/menaquinone biosynthesis C-methylase UbiE